MSNNTNYKWQPCIPVGLVDGAAEDEGLEVGEGEGDGERVQPAVPQHHAAHLPLQAGKSANNLTTPGVQFNRHLKFKTWVKAWVKDEVKDAFRKALDREMVKAWVKAVQNVY